MEQEHKRYSTVIQGLLLQGPKSGTYDLLGYTHK